MVFNRKYELLHNIERLIEHVHILKRRKRLALGAFSVDKNAIFVAREERMKQSVV